ncbi:hypothetical protein O1D04_003614 [Vibrio cholerae]|uniref:hypothetical protein n=1 Tax=Vibrio cholerae TaxID=666 RepID=UPI00163D07EC|nr:hypothetical protein [Vibrio cholerae]EKF9771389.1 hypothetical protein [Vibrio cholerae]
MKKLLSISSFVLGIFSTIVISMGSSGILGDLSDTWSEWGDVSSAYKLMQDFNRNAGKYGHVQVGEPGFDTLANVIGQNVRTINPSSLSHIVLVHPATFAGVKELKVQVAYKGSRDTQAIADFTVFQSWVNQAKSQDYLYTGLFWLFLSFVVGLAHHYVEDEA